MTWAPNVFMVPGVDGTLLNCNVSSYFYRAIFVLLDYNYSNSINRSQFAYLGVVSLVQMQYLMTDGVTFGGDAASSDPMGNVFDAAQVVWQNLREVPFSELLVGAGK